MIRPGNTLTETLRGEIIQGTYRPGQKLSETQLAQKYEVSRNTLREAFRVLAEQGLVEYVRHRGVTVTSPSMADVVDIYRTRRYIEAGVLAAASPLHPEVDAMREAIARAVQAEEKEDWSEVGSANMAFHSALVALSDSLRLSKVHDQIAAELRLVFLALDDAKALHRPFVAHNQRILQLFTEQGPAAATIELEHYLTVSERTVLGVFTRMGRN